METIAKISNIEENNNILKFTVNNINVSYINAIRRTLLSNIPCIVLKNKSSTENLINIFINKSRLNNELLKQRLCSIPVHINATEEFPFNDYILELDKKNTTNTIIYATTEDFKIKNVNSGIYLSPNEVSKIFPPDPITGDFIDIARLRPKLSENLSEEHIKLEAILSIGDAAEDGMYNVVSTCAYGNTLDSVKIKEVWEEKEKGLKDKVSKEDIEFMKKDWLLLDAKRLFIDDSFDFIIETVGIYDNFKLIELACSVLIKKIYGMIELLKHDGNLISENADTLPNCYTIIFKNEDYTVGKILEYCLYSKYFIEKKEINFVGFLKKHPHDEDSIIKISFKQIISIDEILIILEECANQSILLINSIKEYFTGGEIAPHAI